MQKHEPDQLSRRERQIMNILYRLGTASAADVQAQLKGEPSYSTVRAQLRILEEKGCVQHDEDGAKYVFRPVVGKENAGRSAIRSLLDTFFGGSAEQMVRTLLDSESARLSPEELERLSRLVTDARKEQGRK
ncbi:MAG: BlaI/MecI/CopY family transcriptional regulator [Bryobacteraceae bacterium]|nr:BlaI/MecI/CopY family transcriptional regulator [Bryobacteraceae bacterium]